MDGEKDPLEPPEIIALAKAIDAEARNHATFRKYLERALSVGSGGTVVACRVDHRRATDGASRRPVARDDGRPLGLALADPESFARMLSPMPAPEEAPPADAVPVA